MLQLAQQSFLDFQDMAQYQRLELGNPKAFMVIHRRGLGGGVLVSLPRGGVGLAPIPPKLTMSSCGTRPWHLGGVSECAQKVLLLFVVPLGAKQPIYL